jgi:hypothetical protein
VWQENLAYALVQVGHNFGAAVVLGGAVFALWPAPRLEYARALARLIAFAWGAQIVSGALFGATSLYYYGATPDLGSVAIAALAFKVVAATAGFLLAAACLLRGSDWSRAGVKRCFRVLAALGVVALTAAAFLRWFS